MMKAEALGYEFALHKARDDNNETAVKQLEEILPYPTSLSGDHHKRPIARHWARHYGWQGSAEASLNRKALMTTPEYSLVSIYRYLKGSLFSLRLANQLIDPPLQPAIQRKNFDIPMYFLCGKTDAYTPTSLVDEYVLSLSAPVKEHIVFENSGHWPMLTECDDYLGVLVDKVRPHIL
jgi:pimeloyl-ACP methyl ester carboxylesterase